MKKAINVIWQANCCSSKIWEYDWLCLLLKNFSITHIFDSEYKACLDKSIIVTPGKHKHQSKIIEDYIGNFKKNGLKVGVIHLGDEWCTDFIDFYGQVNFVFRNYYRTESHKFKNCFYFPLGYKSQFCTGLVLQNMNNRKYSWSFAGHVKGARYKMLKSAQKISGGLHYETQMFNDPKGLSTQNYAELLNQTIFALCPRGNFSLDTFRLYEALEAGAIPIVEDRGGTEILKEVFDLQSFRDSGCYKPSYWRLNFRYIKTRSYWQQAYGEEFPCPRIYDWKKLEAFLAEIDIETTSSKIRNWWKNYKESLSKLINSLVEEAFFS